MKKSGWSWSLHFWFILQSTRAQVGGRSREGQTLRSVFSFDLATTTWKRYRTAIFLHLPIYVFFIYSHQRLPDMKEVRWYHGAVVIGELCCSSILHWEMNLLTFCFTLRDEFVALLVHIERWISLRRWQTLRGGRLRSTWLRWISWAWIFSSWRPAWTTRSTSFNQHYSLQSSISGAKHLLQANLDRPANMGKAHNGNLFVQWRIQGICQG